MSEKHIMSVDEFLNEQDIEYAEIPGFKDGTFIRIGSLSAGDIIEWTEAGEGEARKTAGLRLIIKSLVDADGKRIGETKHLQALKGKNHRVMERIIGEILKLNGMTVAATAEAKNA